MMRLRTAAVTGILSASLLAPVGAAVAGPTLRAGLTIGLRDDTTPDANVVGPVAGIGWRFGALMAELEYAYLSFQDGAALGGGVHRVGGVVRLDLLRSVDQASGEGHGLYAEAGIGERIGRWEVDATHVAPESGLQHESHLGAGVQIDNRRKGYGYGWLLGVRVAFAPHDPSFDALCRGGCTTSSGSTSGTDVAVLFEASLLLGH